jgi:hypothetical protein
MRQQHGKGNEMQANERFGQALVIARQASKASHPSKTALDDPAPRQQHKAALGSGQFDHLKPNAMFFGIRGGLVARVALIHEGDLNRVAGRLLDLGGQVSPGCIHARS